LKRNTSTSIHFPLQKSRVDLVYSDDSVSEIKLRSTYNYVLEAR